MQLRGRVWYSAILGLSAAVHASRGDDTCPNGFAIVELQPYEIVFYNMPDSPVVTGTKTVTEFPQYGYTNIIVPGGHNDHVHHSEWSNSAGSDHTHCAGCATVTTAVLVPFRKTIPPTTKGGVSTIITGVLPDCKNCATVTTTGPVPFVTTIYPGLSDDIPTVVICEEPSTDSEFVITGLPGPKSDIATIPSGTVPGTATIPYTIDDSDDYTTTVKSTTTIRIITTSYLHTTSARLHD
ncbi:FLO9-Lectin expressed and involved in flocculation [Fusarium albosuccineum]|uniref:FLO9-Lectin expressed and involved in flocculation n=1 Tax=Fusarium albosuccineum TaxID=1237068 RepID=A0A8H4PGM7_9HYPO|nr:FLO9-Lectin expressed and involved in flocculation [Fusarium albosuccineum]